MADVLDSLRRARREHAAAVERGDDMTADIIARAIEVLQAAADGKIPRQRDRDA